uniref:Uncharacterized protein n=1 Tax=Panagrolaimus sp. ES5 TaxID=591445 RepID=A0AC34GE94_9BILA
MEEEDLEVEEQDLEVEEESVDLSFDLFDYDETDGHSDICENVDGSVKAVEGEDEHYVVQDQNEREQDEKVVKSTTGSHIERHFAKTTIL